jgi:hypothetical protein
MRLVVSVSLCIGGVFLAYFGSRSGWWSGLGIGAVGLGLILLLARIPWEGVLCSDQEQHSEQREPIHKDEEKVAQGKIENNFDGIALVLRLSGVWENLHVERFSLQLGRQL